MGSTSWPWPRPVPARPPSPWPRGAGPGRPSRGRRVDRGGPDPAPEVAVGRAARGSGSTSTRVERSGRRAAGRHARHRDDLPAGGHARPPCARWPRRVRGARRDPPCRRRSFVGLGGGEAFGGAGRRLSLSGTPFRSRLGGHTVRRVPPRRGPAGLRVRVRRGAGRWRGRASGVLPPHRRVHGVGGHDGEVVRGRVRRRSRPGSGRTSGCARRCRSRANGCPSVIDAAHERLPSSDGRSRRRRTGDRDRPAARPGHRDLLARRTGFRPVVASEDPTASARIGRFAEGRPVDRRGEDGVRRRRRPSSAPRRVRHHHHHRAVLPPGGRPRRSLHVRDVAPTCLLLRSRRSHGSATTPPSSPSSGGTASARRGEPTRQIAYAVGRSRRRPADRRRGADEPVRGHRRGVARRERHRGSDAGSAEVPRRVRIGR